MLLGNVMWEIFQNTGHIEAYLIYRSCNDDNTQQLEVVPESQARDLN
ncbi:YqzL family protein [Dendrosporobacter sp. 1207_IL3150]